MAEVTAQTRVFNYTVNEPANIYSRSDNIYNVLHNISKADDKCSCTSTTHIFSRKAETGYSPDDVNKGATIYIGLHEYDKADSISFIRKDDNLIFEVQRQKNNSTDKYVFLNQFKEGAVPALDRLQLSYNNAEGNIEQKTIDLRAGNNDDLEYRLNGFIDLHPRKDIAPDMSKTVLNISGRNIHNVTYKLEDCADHTVTPKFESGKNVLEQYMSPYPNYIGNYNLDLTGFDKANTNIFTPTYGADSYARHSEMLRIAVEDIKQNSRYILEVPHQFSDSGHMQKFTIIAKGDDGNYVKAEIDGDEIKNKEAFSAALQKNLAELGFNKTAPALTQTVEAELKPVLSR